MLPSSGKIVHLEELEASQLSPPLVPSGSSTPADSAVTVNVSRKTGNVSADMRQRTSAPATGRVHRGPGPSLPSGAQVQTLEEIEAGLRSMNLPPSASSPVNKASTVTSAAVGDLTAFNKLLQFVNKSQPVTDQARCYFC